LERGDECRFLNDAAACAVEEPDAAFALRQRGLVNHVVRRLGERHVHGDVVTLREKLVERDALNLHRLGAAGREIRIVGNDAHSKGLGALGDFTADTA